MEEDSIDKIELSSTSYDSFHTKLVLKEIIDHSYEKVREKCCNYARISIDCYEVLFYQEKYLLKDYQIMTYLIEATSEKYIEQHTASFIDLLQLYFQEKFNRQQTRTFSEASLKHHSDPSSLQAHITIFAYSIKYYSLKLLELEYIYKMILQSEKLGIKPINRYFRLRKQIILLNSNSRNNPIFIDRITLKFEEWSGIVCRNFGNEFIVEFGHKIRAISRQFNRVDKILDNSVNALFFMKLTMKHIRSQNKSIKITQLIGPSSLSPTIPHHHTSIIRASTPTSQRKSTLENSYIQQNSTQNRAQTPTLPSKSPSRYMFMNQPPPIFSGAQYDKILSDKKEVVLPQSRINEKNSMAIKKDGILISNDLAFRYQELAAFTKDLLTAVKKTLIIASKGTPISQDDQYNLLKQTKFEGKFISDPFSLLKDSVSLANPSSSQKNK